MKIARVCCMFMLWSAYALVAPVDWVRIPTWLMVFGMAGLGFTSEEIGKREIR